MRSVTRLLACALLAAATGAEASVLNPFEKNLQALNDAILTTASTIVQDAGRDITSLRYAGEFSGSGWNAGLDGTYAGRPFSMAFTANFDTPLDQGTFSSSGMFGQDTWNGFGTWSFSDVDADTVGMEWDSVVDIMSPGGSHRVFDRRLLGMKLTSKTPLNGFFDVTDVATFQYTIFGVPVPFLRDTELSNWIIPKEGPAFALVSLELLELNVLMDGTADFDSGETSGTVTFVPLPESLPLLLAALALGAFWTGGRNRGTVA